MQSQSRTTSIRARGKLNRGRFDYLLMSPVLGYSAWAVAAILAMYRAIMGEWFVLGVCGIVATACALLQFNWNHIPLQLRGKLLFSLGVLFSWSLLTMHSPAYALFFDTLENGLTTLFGRFGVSGVENIPQWIGGVFRILGIVFLSILALRFGRSREDDDEGTRAVVGKVVQLLAGLLVADALIELFLA